MKKKLPIEFPEEQLTEHLAKTGLRITAQRRHVYGVLLENRDHPSAEDVFIRAKHKMPDISMATVYNCLETLVRCGLLRQVKVERGPARFCSNMREHHHFYCEVCGATFDIERTKALERMGVQVPSGFKVRRYEIALRGTCPTCATEQRG